MYDVWEKLVRNALKPFVLTQMYLFQAHREDRRAQNHLKAGRFDEAVICHQLAAKHIEDAMSSTSTSRAIESLQLQREYHLRQLQIVE